MKRLGTVLHKIDNLLIVHADITFDKSGLSPRSIVITKKMKRIGTIKEMFGPLDNPYFSIQLYKGITGSELLELKNERVYLQ